MSQYSEADNWIKVIEELKARNAKLVAALEEADREISTYTGTGAISRVRQIIRDALTDQQSTEKP